MLFSLRERSSAFYEFRLFMWNPYLPSFSVFFFRTPFSYELEHSLYVLGLNVHVPQSDYRSSRSSSVGILVMPSSAIRLIYATPCTNTELLTVFFQRSFEYALTLRSVVCDCALIG